MIKSATLLTTFLVFLGISQSATAHELISEVIAGTSFQLKCDFGPSALACVSAKSKSSAGIQSCRYKQTVPGASLTEFICDAPTTPQSIENYCTTFRLSDPELLAKFPGCSQEIKSPSVIATVKSGKTLLQEEADWINNNLVTWVRNPKSGLTYYAIATTPLKQHIEPYFANLAAQSLLLANPTKYRATVEYWMGWYLDHVNTPDVNGTTGSVYKYDLSNSFETPTYTYDSVDSYAATFLTLTKLYLQTYPDGGNFFTSQRKQKLVSVMTSIYQMLIAANTGLSIASRPFPAQYVADNAEVVVGLRDYAYASIWLGIYNINERYFFNLSSSVQSSIERLLWNSNQNDYYVQLGGPATVWSIFYPDVVSVLWPTIMGLTDSSRSKLLWGKFQSSPLFERWLNLTVDIFPLASLSTAGIKAGDKQNVSIFLNNALNKQVRPRVSVWHVGESAAFIRALVDLGS
jgi:hypothetical protein